MAVYLLVICWCRFSAIMIHWSWKHRMFLDSLRMQSLWWTLRQRWALFLCRWHQPLCQRTHHCLLVRWIMLLHLADLQLSRPLLQFNQKLLGKDLKVSCCQTRKPSLEVVLTTLATRFLANWNLWLALTYLQFSFQVCFLPRDAMLARY